MNTGGVSPKATARLCAITVIHVTQGILLAVRTLVLPTEGDEVCPKIIARQFGFSIWVAIGVKLLPAPTSEACTTWDVGFLKMQAKQHFTSDKDAIGAMPMVAPDWA